MSDLSLVSIDAPIANPVRITVSHSEVESYLRCERQHYYGYGLELQRSKESDSLTRGTLGHATLEVFFKRMMEDNNFEEAKLAAYGFLLPNAGSMPILVQEIVECLQFFFEGYPFIGWKIIGVEFEQTMYVTDKLSMPFIIDLVAQDPFGKIWVIDHKFMYDFVTDRDAELMPQLVKYFVGMKVMGHAVDNMAYSVLRYRSLKEPTVESKYRFIPVEATPTRQKQTIVEQVVVSDRIQQQKSLPLAEWSGQAMRTANKMVCNSCSFRSLCVAELNDWQPQLILDAEYEKKKRREFITIEAKAIEMKDEYA